jgi:hypothetical protein
MIIVLGYRVQSQIVTSFRLWAMERLSPEKPYDEFDGKRDKRVLIKIIGE